MIRPTGHAGNREAPARVWAGRPNPWQTVSAHPSMHGLFSAGCGGEEVGLGEAEFLGPLEAVVQEAHLGIASVGAEGEFETGGFGLFEEAALAELEAGTDLDSDAVLDSAVEDGANASFGPQFVVAGGEGLRQPGDMDEDVEGFTFHDPDVSVDVAAHQRIGIARFPHLLALPVFAGPGHSVGEDIVELGEYGGGEEQPIHSAHSAWMPV